MRFVSENVPALKLIDSCLRLLVIPLSLASICLAVNNHQDNSIYGKLEFSNFKGFKYLICVSAFSGGYALVAAVFAWVRVLANKAWLFFISDQVIAYLLITSVSAVAETTYLLYNGARDVSWSEACISYGKFCNKLVLILGVNALAFLVFLILALISAYRVFSLYEPPYLHSKEVEEERT
ncbi:hypothetical protein POM88_045296 [Heracleum sosnowskyi]|uniref:CASP-like protein n=1 Tax=Heracleum sosnowskyi TaxID=360622 RepID=A0AAD8H757_9APIA|nr:hypothetical protein POM88_045296 [Heracleum sosnowskyi]